MSTRTPYSGVQCPSSLLKLHHVLSAKFNIQSLLDDDMNNEALLFSLQTAHCVPYSGYISWV